MEVLQIPSELEQMVALYRKHKPKRVLEIGCWDGGTLRVWLTDAYPTVVVAVDPEHRNPEAYEGWRRPRTKLHIGNGFSQSADMVALIREYAPYDWVFVDGDHGYAAVRADVDLCLPLVQSGGVLLLHDITPSTVEETPGPLQVFQELQDQGYRTDEFTVAERFPWTAGIGVVYL